MKISRLFIRNFKSIKQLSIENIDNTLILVGRNSTGKTIIMDALLAVTGAYLPSKSDFRKNKSNIEIGITLDISDSDLLEMNKSGKISRYKKYDRWYKDFLAAFPGFENNKLSFIWTMNYDGTIRFEDQLSKDNPLIKELLPHFFYLDYTRNIEALERELVLQSSEEDLKMVSEEKCIFDTSRSCNNCFQCIGTIEKKNPTELTIAELSKLIEYRLCNENSSDFAKKLDENFHKNSGYTRHLEVKYAFNGNDVISPSIAVLGRENTFHLDNQKMSAGMKSLYALSLLETYVDTNSNMPFVIMIEDPELFLHPTLQKNACEILSKLSKTNQVIFTTHSPNMLFNFNQNQIKQVYLDKENNTSINNQTDIDYILNDLGYSANDVLAASFVFFVEGKQDRSRLPLLLEKFYSDIKDKDGSYKRISIITTNSCTNIKTYANLKYMNQLYIKDQFLMIRDGDGKDRKKLINDLCSYYKDREVDDKGYIPRVSPKNILVLKYYSFENYFLNPKIMAKIGVIPNEESFYTILLTKYNEYLKNQISFKRLAEKGITFKTVNDIKNHMEDIKIYGRGHNLFNIFYGKYKGKAENEILTKYINEAPKDEFKDIFDAIEAFSFFDNRKKP